MQMHPADNVLLMITMSPIASIVTDPKLDDNPIIACNQAFIELTGYEKDEIIGRNCRFLSGRETNPEATAAIVRAVDENRPVVVEILNYRKDGSAFQNAVMVAPILDDEGNVTYFLGSQVDVTERHVGLDERKKHAIAQVASLTRRQKEVIGYIADGHLNKQIAHKMGLRERTIKMHRAAMLKKLGVNSSADAIRIAVEAGL